MTEVERTVRFAADATELWDAMIDAALLEEWFGGDVSIDLRPGGALRVVSDAAVREAVVDDVDPARRLAFTWSSDDGGPGSTVEIELEPFDDGCALHVREVLVEGAAPNAFPIGFQPPPAYRTGEALALARS
jgi:uncharacterized protein YndB with AHSA1/START domain